MSLVTPPSMRYNAVEPREYMRIHAETVSDLESFWARQASQLLRWEKSWSRVLAGESAPRIRWFENGLLSPYFNIVGRHLSTSIESKPALIVEDEDGSARIASYRELDAISGILARALRDLGVGKESWVLFYAPYSVEVLAAFLASLRLGASAEFVFTGFGWRELKKRILNRRPRVVVALDAITRRGKKISLIEALERSLAGTEPKPEVVVVESSRSSVKWRSFDEFLKGSSRLERDAVVESSHPLVGFHVGYEEDFEPLAHGAGGYLTQVVSVTRWLGLRARDTLYCTVSPGWITAVSHCIVGALAIGSTIVAYTGAPDYPSWERWLEILDYYSVTVFLTTSSALRLLLRRAGDRVGDYELDSLKIVVTTGEPMEESLWSQAYAKLGSSSSPLIDSIPGKSGRIPVFNAYIQTELGSFATGHLTSSAFGPIAPGSAGLPVLGLAVDVAGEDCSPVRNAWGRLVLRKPWPSIPVEYPREFEESWSGGCYDTRDSALMTSEGYIYVRGRRDQVIKASGYRLSPGAIEKAIEESGAAGKAVASGVPDEERFEAVLVAVENGDPQAVRKTVRELVGPIAEPSIVLHLELSGDKRSLRRALRERSARGYS